MSYKRESFAFFWFLFFFCACRMFKHHHDPAIEALRSSLWFVTAISNPERYKTRYELYKTFREHVINDLHANLLTVESQVGERAFQITEAFPRQPDDSRVRVIDVQLRCDSHCWNKESQMNAGLSRLPSDAKYVIFADADIEFQNRDIVTETIHALQVHPVVQPFETTIDLGPNGEVLEIHKSFGWCHQQGLQWGPPKTKNGVAMYDPYPQAVATGNTFKGLGNVFHPGYAIAFRLDVLNKLGGLIDVGILGASDHHMCLALIGKARYSVPGQIHPNYLNVILAWQKLADLHIRGDFGYVRGKISAAFHGPKRNRAYIKRWSILTKHNFDPLVDVRRNLHGLWEFTENNPGFRDDMRRYFKSRLEDDICTT